MIGVELLNKARAKLESAYHPIMYFKSLSAFEKFDEEKVNSFNEEWQRHYNDLKNDVNSILESSESEYKVETYGDPPPLNFEDAIKRNQFQNMPLFYNRYNEIYDLLKELEKKSESLIDKPKMIFTDKEVGMFSMDRFMMGIYPAMGFYDAKNKIYIKPENILYSEKYNIVVDKGETYTNKDGDIFMNKDNSPIFEKQNIQSVGSGTSKKYFLFPEKNPLKYVQIENGSGVKKYKTTNRKVYYTKSIVRKSSKAIRIFIQIGNRAGLDCVNAGLAACAVSYYMEAAGYNVRISAVMNTFYSDTLHNHKSGLRGQSGYRVTVFDLKTYSESLDLPSILYVTADPSFFRIKGFRHKLAEQYNYGDDFDAGYGSTQEVEKTEAIIISAMKKRDIDFEESTLYYFIGGHNIRTFDDAKKRVIQIIKESEQINKEALLEAQSIRL